MKAKPSKANSKPARGEGAGAPAEGHRTAGATPPTPPGRRRAFRLVALLLPLVLVGLTEVALRVGGYGYPTKFFLPIQEQGGAALRENQQFTRRFFPPGLARSPQPFILPAVKPPHACRIFIFGESAAMGDPEPAIGVARMLEVMLREGYPGKQFEVVNTGITAINSHVVRQIARDCAPRAGDVWIIYMGNNEVIGPFGAGTVFSAQTPPLPVIRAQIALKSLRLGQLADDLRYRLTHPAAQPASWEGMEMFLKQQIRADDPRLARVYAHFAANLGDMLALGRKAGARLLVSTVASNLKDCPPFASQHKKGLPAAEQEQWNRHYQAGLAAEAATNFTAALAAYQQAAGVDDTYAELAFRRGRCFWGLGQYPEARRSFERARDLDALRFRADSRLNQLIQEAARRQAGPGLRFVDAAEQFAAASPHGIPGAEWLYEHVHLNFEGNYLLARLFAEHLHSLLPAAITGGAATPPALPDAQTCARRLAWTDWDRSQLVEELVKRLEQPPFTAQLDHPARLQPWQRLRTELEAASRREALAPAAAIYQDALARAPADWVLHARLGRLRQHFGDAAGTERECRKVTELIPHYADAYFQLGNALEAQGRGEEARRCLELAVRQRPEATEARVALGLLLANQGRLDEATAQYRQALRQKPNSTEAHINLGQLVAGQGRTQEAAAHYQHALRSDSNSLAAHINLGKLLCAQGRVAEGIEHYREAVRLQPDHAIARYNLGNALARQRQPEALTQYAEAVRLQPDFAEARYNLAMQLIEQGRQDQALPHLAEAARLQPDFAEAHFNYGVALAKAGRYGEALTQFEETLRLQPAHPQARQFLEKVRRLR